MGLIITRNNALKLIRQGDARAKGLMYKDDSDKTFMVLDRLDEQCTDHYFVGNGDLRDTSAGKAAEATAGVVTAE